MTYAAMTLLFHSWRKHKRHDFQKWREQYHHKYLIMAGTSHVDAIETRIKISKEDLLFTDAYLVMPVVD